MSRQISRDPFARESLHRETIKTASDCSWCGQQAKFRYYTEPDAIYVRKNYLRGEFCSIGCMRAYHN